MKGFIARIVTILASRVLTRASQVVAFVVLARVLSPAGFGAYGVLTSAVFLAGQIGNLGLRQSAAFRIGSGRMQDGQAIGILLALWPILSIVCGGVILLTGGVSLSTLSGSGAQGAWGLSVATVVAVASVLLLTLLQGVFLGRGEMKAFALSDAGPRILQSVLVFLIAVVGLLTAETAIWSFAISFLLLAPIAIWLALRGASRVQVQLSTAPDMIRHGLLFAVSLFLITFQGRVGVFFLSGADGTAAAGQFFAAQRACEIFLELATAVGLVLFSDTARKGATKEGFEKARKTATTMALLFLVLGAGAAAVAGPAVNILLGPAYADAVGPFRILALGLAAAAYVRLMNSVVAGAGKPWISGGVVVVGLSVNILICLSPFLEPGQRAAVGFVAGNFVSMAIYGLIVSPRLGRSTPIEKPA